MRIAVRIVVGLAVLVGMVGAARAQAGWADLQNAAKKGAADAAKQKADESTGVSGTVDKAADPKAAAKGAAQGAVGNANDSAVGAAHDAGAAGVNAVAPKAAGEAR